jgi:hypothetical protein
MQSRRDSPGPAAADRTGLTGLVAAGQRRWSGLAAAGRRGWRLAGWELLGRTDWHFVVVGILRRRDSVPPVAVLPCWQMGSPLTLPLEHPTGWASDPIQRPGRKRFLVAKVVRLLVYSTAGQTQVPKLVGPAVQMPASQRRSVSRRGLTAVRMRSLVVVVDRMPESRLASQVARKLECRKHLASDLKLMAARIRRRKAVVTHQMDSPPG